MMGNWQKCFNPILHASFGGHSFQPQSRPPTGGLFCLCFYKIKRIIAVMVIQIEYGNGEETIKSDIRRNIIKPQLPAITESFFAQDSYRWGKMYVLSGKTKTLIRQF